jgi:hypothetical protein
MRSDGQRDLRQAAGWAQAITRRATAPTIA